MASRRYTTSLINSRGAALVGGKGASLGRLIRAGFRVPGGFVVTTDAYRLARTPLPDAGTTGPIPPEIAGEIRDRYEQMGRGSVAVRSSATAEDLAAASMAGQCETFLDIDGDEALIEAGEHAQMTPGPPVCAVGLVLCRLILAAHAGIVDRDSGPGRGPTDAVGLSDNAIASTDS
jgi:hypothetical protein